MLGALERGRAFEALHARIHPLAHLVHAFANTLEAPVFDESKKGYFYREAGIKHFCLLKAVRIVSGLHASVGLARMGFTQEVAVVIRTVIECSSQIQFVLVGIQNGSISPEATQLIFDYFQDTERRTVPAKGAQIRQKKLHDVIGADLDVFKEATEDPRSTTVMLSDIYFRFSYYVHARYPETMDLYGGRPGQFHLNGMAGTPKDIENIEIIDSQITSASLCLKGMVQGLRLFEVLATAGLQTWYASV
jgi:hypothetical protein